MPTRSNAPAPEPRDPRVDRLTAEIDVERDAEGRWPARASVPVTVLVPTKDEHANIVECARRLRWAAQVVVVDSGSADDTVARAQAMGCEVYWFDYAHHSPHGWPKKRNWALETLPLRHEWVLFMDADERMTPELAREIDDVIAGRRVPARSGNGDGFWINRKLVFMGRFIEHCGYYPSWNLRLFKHRLGRYERMTTIGDTASGDMEVHEHVTLMTGAAGHLDNDFVHHAYPDVASWVEKHNRYSSWEAHVSRDASADELGASPFGSPLQRKRWMKRVSRRLPARPTLRFLYHYVWRSGFRDGYPGWVLCRLLGTYELMTVAKERELRAASRP